MFNKSLKLSSVVTIWTFLLVTVCALSFPGAVMADVFLEADSELRDVGSEAGFNTNYRDGTLQIFIARIIQQLLTFLGIIFFVLVVYAGFLWMTAGGSEEQVGKAQKILARAGIGLGIVVLAYAITVFVMKALLRGAGLDPSNP